MESYNTIRRGDVFFAELTGGVGSEQNGVRPVLVLQNDVGNRHSPTIIVAPLTSKGNMVLRNWYGGKGHAGMNGRPA